MFERKNHDDAIIRISTWLFATSIIRTRKYLSSVAKEFYVWLILKP